jgi:carbon storage regulator
MLVLCRKVGETIVVPALNLRLIVVSVEGKKVRLGVTAPATVAVHREEVWDRISHQRPSRGPKDERGGRPNAGT